MPIDGCELTFLVSLTLNSWASFPDSANFLFSRRRSVFDRVAVAGVEGVEGVDLSSLERLELLDAAMMRTTSWEKFKEKS